MIAPPIVSVQLAPSALCLLPRSIQNCCPACLQEAGPTHICDILRIVGSPFAPGKHEEPENDDQKQRVTQEGRFSLSSTHALLQRMLANLRFPVHHNQLCECWKVR